MSVTGARALWVVVATYAAFLTAVSILPSGPEGGPLGGWDKDILPASQNAAHVPAYAVLALLAGLAWRGRREALRWTAAVLVGLGAAGYGALLECVQAAIPGRTGSLGDVLLNLAGAAIGAVVAFCILPGRSEA